jgi:hypothetical protein
MNQGITKLQFGSKSPKQKALFTFVGRISAKREAPDAAIFDESMAKAP